MTKISLDTGKVQLDREHGLYLLQQMLRIRRFEEKCAELYSAMKIRGFLHLYIGEEAVAVGLMEALRPEDNIVATYREHGQALARGVPATTIMAEMYGKQEGCARGRGGSMHLFDKDTRFYGGNAIVAGHLPMAVGMALADKMRGEKRVTVVFFGDGAVAEGEFHESLNLAKLWELPVLFVCENNRYGMGTAIEYAHAVTDLASRASAYNIPAKALDGMDVLAMEAAAHEVVTAVRESGEPWFLEVRTYRFRAHSMFDAELYRDKSEVAEWKVRDPIEHLKKEMENAGLLTQADMDRMEQEVAAEINESVEFAEAGTWEPIEDLARFVYSEEVVA
jgi:pyruvate dehydrogenase E1 component alpha subunit